MDIFERWGGGGGGDSVEEENSLNVYQNVTVVLFSEPYWLKSNQSVTQKKDNRLQVEVIKVVITLERHQ